MCDTHLFPFFNRYVLFPYIWFVCDKITVNCTCHKVSETDWAGHDGRCQCILLGSGTLHNMFTSYCCFFCSACYLHVCLKYIFSAYDQIAPTRCRSCPIPGVGWSLWHRFFQSISLSPKLIYSNIWFFIDQTCTTARIPYYFFARPPLAKLWSITKRIPFLPRSPLPYLSHDDVMTWKRFPYSWPFERGIHR